MSSLLLSTSSRALESLTRSRAVVCRHLCKSTLDLVMSNWRVDTALSWAL